MNRALGDGEGRPSLFILSGRERDALTTLAAETGWQSISARRIEGAEQRYLSSDAKIALVDLRGEAAPEALVALLATAVEASGGALLVLIDEGLLKRVPALMAAGATHYLPAPITRHSLAAALSSARTMTERLGGGLAQRNNRHAIERSDSLSWRFDGGSGHVMPSTALARILGIAAAPMRPSALLRTLPREERAAAFAAIGAAALKGTSTAFAHDLPGQAGRRVAHHLYPDAGGMSGAVELLSGQSARPGIDRDYLTGLANRLSAVEWIGAQQLLDPHSPTILLLSISQFDRVNAAYGQIAGDALLSRVARRIERLVEDIVAPGAMIARIAGTEFLVGLDAAHLGNAGTERAIFLARRLIAAIGQPFSAGDHLIRLTGRCGIAEAQPGDDAVRLLRRAGMALADARQSDGEGIRILSAEAQSREVDPDRLESDLRLALDRGEIGIVFQPQYATSDDHIVGVEALARWNHPVDGPLSAGVLFAAAGRSDFILPLSAHIQAEALRLAAAWPPALSALRLSVNVTAADIAQPDFLETFLGLVDGSGFPRSRLTVEITESGLIEDVDAAAVLLDRLRSGGLAVAIDDFGTGYSSLAYLKSLPLDYLKIDSGLAQDIAGSPRDRIIVRGVIHMAKSLGLKVIAEGVETEQQLALLAREGCDLYQGFLRSAGVGCDELINIVSGLHKENYDHEIGIGDGLMNP